MRKLQLESDLTIVQGCLKKFSLYEYELFLRYSEVLYTTCIRYVGCQSKAKDVLQESFILVFKYLHTYDNTKASLYTWMNKICVNQSLKFIKSSYSIIDYNNYSKIETVMKHPSPEETLLVQDLLQKIIELEEPYRTVFNLYEIEGYAHKEIAKIMSVEEVSSRTILHRAKKLLKIDLSDYKVYR